ncbi:hypothetical protein CVU37_08315 [candidate division BRC1 bacterium HGW-BRC1-1]|jgi:DNA-binding NtrC family response regulator|nr:MAG: hypothetical protein CVU37_08315 [candidate division BRC1 bacterium HGW-BRC1-1]
MSVKARILIAEDEERLRRLLGILLSGRGYDLTMAADGAEAWRLFQDNRFDLVLTDVRMPELDGMQLLSRIKEHAPETPVVVITAFGSIESAVEAMRGGAVDYLPKPFEEARLHLAIERGLEMHALLKENISLRREVRTTYNLEHIVAESAQMREVLAMVGRVAPTNATVMVLGESGTGKELVTRAIHEQSKRARGPFIAINCAAMADSLLESELFGHERGSFTGATNNRQGKFEAAEGGTLFLDEVAEMSLEMQSKVLRAIEMHEIERVGGRRVIPVDVRFIAATNKDLHAAVLRGAFREDLYFRINVFPVLIPPLRERIEDILPLARFFLSKFAQEMGRRTPHLTASTEKILLQHFWSGNVRELRNIMERMSIMAAGDEVGSDILSCALAQPGSTGFGGRMGENNRAENSPLSVSGFSLDEHERRLLMEALSRSGHNKSKAAKMLGISRAKLRYRLDKIGLNGEGDDPHGG